MAVSSFDLVRCNSYGGTIDGHQTAQLLYQAITSDRYDDGYVVLSDSRCPQRGSGYVCGNTSKPFLYAQTGNAVLRAADESRMLWDVTIDYSTQGQTQNMEEDKANTDPIDWRPKCSTFSQKVRRPYLRDTIGTLIKSSAGEPYDPVQERDETKFGIRIVRNIKRSDPAFNSTFKDAINLDDFWGCEVSTVKVEIPGTAVELYHANYGVYYEETWEFAIDPETWNLKLADYGMNKIVDDELVPIQTANGQYLTSPQLLDGAGAPLAVGAEPVLLPTFFPYTYKRFADLRLPSSFGGR